MVLPTESRAPRGQAQRRTNEAPDDGPDNVEVEKLNQMWCGRPAREAPSVKAPPGCARSEYDDFIKPASTARIPASAENWGPTNAGKFPSHASTPGCSSRTSRK